MQNQILRVFLIYKILEVGKLNLSSRYNRCYSDYPLKSICHGSFSSMSSLFQTKLPHTHCYTVLEDLLTTNLSLAFCLCRNPWYTILAPMVKSLIFIDLDRWLFQSLVGCMRRNTVVRCIETSENLLMFRIIIIFFDLWLFSPL